MRFSEHPLRRQIVGEMHLRRFPALELPAMAFQTVRLVDENDREKEWLILEQRCASGLDRNLRHLETEWSANGRLAWERHSEAVTTTLTSTSVSADAQFWSAPDVGPFSDTLQWMETLPGLVIRATHIVVVANDSYAEPVVDRADFHPGHLVSCIIGDSVRIWSDFRIHAGGYGRLVVAANGAADGEVSRSIQRIQELGNYRNLSLLDLPVARAGWAMLDQIERDLDDTGRALVGTGQTDDALLASLSEITARLLALASETDSRLSATSAYGEIVTERLNEVRVQALPGYQSLADFTGRRFNPAVRTCRDFQTRLAQISLRAAQFTALLRARIETQIENQNARLLASMDRSAWLQLRLQHLVEGLSAIAVSYYALGLASYPIKALEKLTPAFPSALLLGTLAPLVVVVAFLAIARARRRVTIDSATPSNRVTPER